MQSNLKSYNTESKSIERIIRECGFTQLRIKNQYTKYLQQDFISLKQKQEYLAFLLTHKHIITKEQKEILNHLNTELKENTQIFNKNLKYISLDSNQIALIKKLGVKNSSFSLIYAKEHIRKTLNILERIDKYYLNEMDIRLHDTQQQTLNNNLKIINEILQTKYDYYIKFFQEYEKQQLQDQNIQNNNANKHDSYQEKYSYSNSNQHDNNNSNIQSNHNMQSNQYRYDTKTLLYYLKEFSNLTEHFTENKSLQYSIQNRFTTHRDNTLTTTKTINTHNIIKTNKHNNEIQDINTHSHKQSQENILSDFHKDFIEWYINSRDIRNKDHYREVLAKQILNNTFKDYEKHIQDYKYHIFLLKRQQEKERHNKDNRAR